MDLERLLHLNFELTFLDSKAFSLISMNQKINPVIRHQIFIYLISKFPIILNSISPNKLFFSLQSFYPKTLQPNTKFWATKVEIHFYKKRVWTQ